MPNIDINTGAPVEGLAFDSAGDLWTTGQGGEVVKYAIAQLRRSTVRTPAISISARLSEPIGLYFDPAGNLWVADENGQQIAELSKAQLRSSGVVTPVRTIGEARGDPIAVAIGP